MARHRRRFAASALMLSALLGAQPGRAQDASNYPVQGRTLRLIVPHGLGAGADILARLIGPKLAERWKVSVVTDNRTGASGDIGISLAAGAEPDGYTLLCVATVFTINPAIKPELTYDPIKSFAPVSLLSTSVLSLLVAASVPAKSLAEFIDLARRQPGKINYASSGVGSPQYVAMELFKLETKTDLFHVPYRDAPGMFRAMLTGEAQAQVQPLQTAAPYVQNGTVRMLAVMSAERAPAFPDVPTMRELGYPNFVVETWYGMFAPAGTPPAIVAKLNAALDDILHQPDVRELLARQGMTPAGGSPERLANYVKDDLARWQRVVKDAGLKAE
jgi:tripartite-type tricarboxylate transporter receptor subunit TctC